MSLIRNEYDLKIRTVKMRSGILQFWVFCFLNKTLIDLNISKIGKLEIYLNIYLEQRLPNLFGYIIIYLNERMERQICIFLSTCCNIVKRNVNEPWDKNANKNNNFNLSFISMSLLTLPTLKQGIVNCSIAMSTSINYVKSLQNAQLVFL